MVVKFTSTCAIDVCHHYSWKFESLSWRSIFDTTLGDSLAVTGDRSVFSPISSTNKTDCYDMNDWFVVLNALFSNISTISWRPVFNGGRSRSIRREPPTMRKQLVIFITCGCESSSSFFCNLQSRVGTHAVLMICWYEWLGNSTT
jgi:hypothetical protein